MTSLATATTALTTQPPPGRTFDAEQMAAASFLARYNGRTLEAYRDDLRGFFQWAHDHHVEVMRATRPRIELFRVSMEQRELAAATIDRRLSTVCGFYKFAHMAKDREPARHVSPSSPAAIRRARRSRLTDGVPPIAGTVSRIVDRLRWECAATVSGRGLCRLVR